MVIMSEKINVLLTVAEINAEVEFLAITEQTWGYEIIACIFNEQMQSNSDYVISKVIEAAFSQKNHSHRKMYRQFKVLCALPSMCQNAAWYVHIQAQQ